MNTHIDKQTDRQTHIQTSLKQHLLWQHHSCCLPKRTNWSLSQSSFPPKSLQEKYRLFWHFQAKVVWCNYSR